MRAPLSYTAVALALSIAGCSPGSKNEPAASDSAAAARTAADSAGPMQGVQEMQGMGGMMGGKMMDDMRSHMRMMEGISADSLKDMMPLHRQTAANMISQMNREMRDMDMQGDAGWQTTMDSVRQDLVRMPEMSGAELRGFIAAHHARMTRLMDMHRSMMSSMRR